MHGKELGNADGSRDGLLEGSMNGKELGSDDG